MDRGYPHGRSQTETPRIRRTSVLDVSSISPVTICRTVLWSHWSHRLLIVRIVCVHVPRDTLGRYLGMLTKESERIRGRAGVEFLRDEQSLLFSGFIFQPHAAVENR